VSYVCPQCCGMARLVYSSSDLPAGLLVQSAGFVLRTAQLIVQQRLNIHHRLKGVGTALTADLNSSLFLYFALIAGLNSGAMQLPCGKTYRFLDRHLCLVQND
jgi:hypothetical protein